MSDKPDGKRREFVLGAGAVIGGAGLVTGTVPFAKSLLPSARAQSEAAPVAVDLSTLGPGELKVVMWQRRPVWILHRTPEMLASLSLNEHRLRDPASRRGPTPQPAGISAPHRALRAEYLVVFGVCSHLGCSPHNRPEPGIKEVGRWWPGGFLCPCHNSLYDLAGRVFKNQPAPFNLPIPPHRYEGDERLVIGEAV